MFPKVCFLPQTAPPGSKKADNDTVGHPNTHHRGQRVTKFTLVQCFIRTVDVRVSGGGGGGGGESVQGGARTTLSPTVLTDDIPPTFLDGLLRRTLLYIAPSGKQGIR